MANYDEGYLDSLEKWSVWTPIEKSMAKSGPDKGKRVVQGIASTEGMDAQNEVVLQEGMDFEPLLRSGFFNWNHQPGPENLIGVPTEARIIVHDHNPALFVKGCLYENHARADAAWNLMNVLEKASADGFPSRRLGWSVEGGVVERKGNLIARSVVRQLALTHEPVNANTFADMAKSMVMAKSVATLGGVAPTLLQNLAGSRDNRSARAVRAALFGEQPDACQTTLGRFKKGKAGLLEHLALCKGWPVSDAKDFVIGMHASVTANYIDY